MTPEEQQRAELVDQGLQAITYQLRRVIERMEQLLETLAEKEKTQGDK